MKLLSFDTSGEQCSVAVFDGFSWHEQSVLAGHTHSQRILPMVADCLAQSGHLALRELDGIAFGAGPGSFTGLRIACGVAQGLAFGADLSLVPVVTLEAMAEVCGAQKVIACIDARMGEVYHAAYARGPGGTWQCMSQPGVYRPDAVPIVDGKDWFGVGNGFSVYPNLVAAYQGQLRDLAPSCVASARAIGTLALPRLARGEGLPADRAAPIYVRSKVALTTAEREAIV